MNKFLVNYKQGENGESTFLDEEMGVGGTEDIIYPLK